ncbi:MAG: hypothetical protein ACR2PS_07400 [Pseudomonadales bacterium]
MKTHRLSVIAAFALVITACSSVADKDGETISMASGEVVDPNKVTCKTYKEIGTRIGSKHCLTNREWKLRSQRAREATDDIQRKSKQTGDANAGG